MHNTDIIKRLAEIRAVVEIATNGTSTSAAYKAAAMIDQLMDEIRFDLPEVPTFPVEPSA